jgi:hypothetical protein
LLSFSSLSYHGKNPTCRQLVKDARSNLDAEDERVIAKEFGRAYKRELPKIPIMDKLKNFAISFGTIAVVSSVLLTGGTGLGMAMANNYSPALQNLLLYSFVVSATVGAVMGWLGSKNATNRENLTMLDGLKDEIVGLLKTPVAQQTVQAEVARASASCPNIIQRR